MDIIETLASELGVDARQVRAVVELIDAGNTIPFVARYRKEVTGGLDDVALRALEERLAYLRNLEARKAEVLRAIDGQGKLTPELRRQITEATVMRRVEDLYKPFRKKRTTRASKARDAGLGPLAELVLSQAAGASSALEAAASYANAAGGYATPEEALAGACDIAAEAIAEDPESVEDLRGFTAREGLLVTEAVDEGAKTPYEQYYGHSEPARSMPNHRVLAANRGEREGKLRVRLDVDKDVAVARLGRHVPRRRGVFADALDAAVADGYKRLMAPSLERELRGELTKRAQQDAIRVFAKNLEFLLSQRPVRGGARHRHRPRLQDGLQGRRAGRVRRPARPHDHLSHAAALRRCRQQARADPPCQPTCDQHRGHWQRHGKPGDGGGRGGLDLGVWAWPSLHHRERGGGLRVLRLRAREQGVPRP